MEQSNTISYKEPDYKSEIVWGTEEHGLTIKSTLRFNWFQRLMWKVFFNGKVKNINSEVENED